TNARYHLFEQNCRNPTVFCLKLGARVRKDHETFDPERGIAKQVRQPVSKTLARGEDVAAHLSGGVTDERGVLRTRAPDARATPRSVGLAHDPPSHGLGFQHEKSARSYHQMIDIAGTAR